MGDWISVDDRLPDEYGLVVAAYLYEFANDLDACVCYFRNGNFRLSKNGIDSLAVVDMTFKPTHWMPLPKPPKNKVANNE